MGYQTDNGISVKLAPWVTEVNNGVLPRCVGRHIWDVEVAGSSPVTPTFQGNSSKQEHHWIPNGSASSVETVSVGFLIPCVYLSGENPV